MLFISLFFFTLLNTHAQTLPILKAKQASENLRFISDDGKITYYTRRSGELQLSTNYSFNTVLTGNKGDNYLLSVSDKKKNVLIEKITAPRKTMNMFKDNDLYQVSYGSSKTATPIGKGVSASLHLDDQWASFYQHESGEILFLNLQNPEKVKRIKPVNSKMSYFVPDTLMVTANDILYTDVNKDGYMALLFYSLLDKKFTTTYKARYAGSKIEFCQIDDSLIIAEFPLHSQGRGSLILKKPLYNNEGFKKSEIIYSSQSNDIGNMTCLGNKIYFAKATQYTKETNIYQSEIARIELALQNKVTILSKMKYMTQTLLMDTLILSPFKGEYYIVDGKANIINDSIEKKEP